jgi:peptidoglycan/LPS O-acetylase OafA/YrhL
MEFLGIVALVLAIPLGVAAFWYFERPIRERE